MDREGASSDRSDGKSLQTGNVVRLPRDWLGPREELVPIGTPRGDTPAGDPATRAPDLSAPVSAQSFWTADAASLHSPLEAGPAVTQSFEEAPPAWGSRARARESLARLLAGLRLPLGVRLPRGSVVSMPRRGLAITAVFLMLALVAFVPALLSGATSIHRAAANLPGKLRLAERSPQPIRPAYRGESARGRPHHVSPRRIRETRARHAPAQTTTFVISHPAIAAGAAAPPPPTSSAPTYQATSAYHAPTAQPASGPAASAATSPQPKRAFGVGGLLGAGSSPSG